MGGLHVPVPSPYSALPGYQAFDQEGTTMNNDLRTCRWIRVGLGLAWLGVLSACDSSLTPAPVVTPMPTASAPASSP